MGMRGTSESAGKDPLMPPLPHNWACDFGVAVDVEDGRPVVWVRGEVDIATASNLGGALADGQARVRSDGVYAPLVVDLCDVTFMGATGLGVLASALAHARHCGNDIVLRNPSPATLRVFDLTGLLDVFAVEFDAGRLSPILARAEARSPLTCA
jgi:anti-anti-sigma factor